MPIYAYRCASCGHAKDVLQKLSDLPLTQCPSCGAQAFTKQVTAAGFQLKGSGWYATDFKGDKSARKSDAGEGAGKTDGADGAKTDGKQPGAPADGGTPAPAPAKTGDGGASASGSAASSGAAKSTGA